VVVHRNASWSQDTGLLASIPGRRHLCLLILSPVVGCPELVALIILVEHLASLLALPVWMWVSDCTVKHRALLLKVGNGDQSVDCLRCIVGTVLPLHLGFEPSVGVHSDSVLFSSMMVYGWLFASADSPRCSSLVEFSDYL
jgi:hypothetical protein